MHSIHDAELLIALLAGVALLGAIAERAGWPYPAVLVAGGLVIGLIPGVPEIRLQPNLVLFGLLPPLVYAAAFETAGADLRSSATQILTLATGLVLLTVAVVAAVARALTGMPWYAAVALGALAAPTDPIAASAVIRRAGAPERIVAILEGESLINDGTGLAVFKVAIAGAAGGLSLGHGAVELLKVSAGGCACGLVCGWLLVQIRRRLEEPALEIALSLLAAFGSYVAAEAAGFSGVLAAVTTGLYAGHRAQEISTPRGRLHTEPFWTSLSFLLESILFLVIGLQLVTLVHGLPHGSTGRTVERGLIITAAALGLRFAWMFASDLLAGFFNRIAGRETARLSLGEQLVLGWSGMRGAVSLAGALAIPLLAAGHSFPHRDEVIFLVYIVVLGTLLVPSFTLGPILRWTGVGLGDQIHRQEVLARQRIAYAALARLAELAEAGETSEDTAERLRSLYELRLERLQAEPGDRDHADGPASAVHARRELLEAQRRAIEEMRTERVVPMTVLGRLEHDIDLEEARLRA